MIASIMCVVVVIAIIYMYKNNKFDNNEQMIPNESAHVSSEEIQLEQLNEIRSIKSMMKFFVILTVISIFLSIVAFVVVVDW